MDRFDKIMTGIVLAGLVGVLSYSRSARVLLDDVRLNVPATPTPGDKGPAYLLTNLPDRRHHNDFAVPVSR